MKPTSPLAELRDLHLPEPIGWWPPAPGWWLLLGLFLILLVGSLLFIQQRRKSRMKRLALAELSKLREEYQRTETALPTLKQLSTLLRRFCISYQSRKQAAALAGEDWLRHLDQLGGGKDFTSGIGRQLASGPYQQQPATDIIALLDLCERWLKKLPNRIQR